MLLGKESVKVVGSATREVRARGIFNRTALQALVELYQDQGLAAGREILANAVDAAMAAGNAEKGAVVTLSQITNDLTIEDFGPGLPPEKLPDIYMTFFGSSKSEDADLIGGRGLGSKSPLGISPEMFVTTFHGGVRTKFLVLLDEDGVVVREIESGVPCGDRTGLSVTFNVPAPHVKGVVAGIGMVYMGQLYRRVAGLAGARIELRGDLESYQIDETELKTLAVAPADGSWVFIPQSSDTNLSGHPWFVTSELLINVGGVLYETGVRVYDSQVVVCNFGASDLPLTPSRDSLRSGAHESSAVVDMISRIKAFKASTLRVAKGRRETLGVLEYWHENGSTRTYSSYARQRHVGIPVTSVVPGDSNNRSTKLASVDLLGEKIWHGRKPKVLILDGKLPSEDQEYLVRWVRKQARNSWKAGGDEKYYIIYHDVGAFLREYGDFSDLFEVLEPPVIRRRCVSRNPRKTANRKKLSRAISWHVWRPNQDGTVVMTEEAGLPTEEAILEFTEGRPLLVGVRSRAKWGNWFSPDVFAYLSYVAPPGLAVGIAPSEKAIKPLLSLPGVSESLVDAHEARHQFNELSELATYVWRLRKVGLSPDEVLLWLGSEGLARVVGRIAKASDAGLNLPGTWWLQRGGMYAPGKEIQLIEGLGYKDLRRWVKVMLSITEFASITTRLCDDLGIDRLDYIKPFVEAAGKKI